MRLDRKSKDRIFYWTCRLLTWGSVVILALLLFHIFRAGWEWLSWDFIENFPSRRASKAGFKSALWGSIWLMFLTAFFSIPVGIATAFYLEEYAKKGFWLKFLEINIANLAGMPSIIYGLLGLAVFVRFLHFDRSILSGSLTLALLVLPVIVIASQQSIRAVPVALREAAYALGARRWQVLKDQVFPAAVPGIMTGVILAISRAMGESAPLIMVGAMGYVAFVPESPMDAFTAMPIQIFNWASRPNEDFHGIAAAGIIVLLVMLLTMNLIAVMIRQKYQRYK